LATAAEAYARVGMAVCDAFIACWYQKYVYNLIRPVPPCSGSSILRGCRSSLEGARPGRNGGHLAQVVVRDRLAAVGAVLLEQLPDPLPRRPRLVTQQPVALIAERRKLLTLVETSWILTEDVGNDGPE
jgi:hypothetical protein